MMIQSSYNCKAYHFSENNESLSSRFNPASAGSFCLTKGNNGGHTGWYAT